MPRHKAASTRERYDQTLHYDAKKDRLPVGTPRPLPTSYWLKENIKLLEQYHQWLLQGGTSESATNAIYLPMAGHVLGLNLKHHGEIDLEKDLECAMEYVQAKGLGESWYKTCRFGLNKFRRFLRLDRGLGEESKVTPFDLSRAVTDLPAWLVGELERYQRLQQRNWRDARVEESIHRFWSVYARIWRFFKVQELADLKRHHILDYVDDRLKAGYAVSSVNGDLHCLHTFLMFLQEGEYSVPQSLLRIPTLKEPDPLPKYLTDEQVKKLRDEFERNVREARLGSHRRQALLARAAFYLLWQGGLRLSEVEELRLEDVDFPQKRLSVRNGKGKKDRTIYLTDTTLYALREYWVVRGDGSSDHVFLYRNAALKRGLIRHRLEYASDRVGIKVHPHRLRHTCATQLLNADCKVTSIQKFLGHKDLESTLVYARAHDQTVADDYFAAMSRVEQRLEIAPALTQETEPENKIVSVPKYAQLLSWVEQLARPELCQNERLNIVESLKEALSLSLASQLSPPQVLCVPGMAVLTTHSTMSIFAGG